MSNDRKGRKGDQQGGSGDAPAPSDTSPANSPSPSPAPPAQVQSRKSDAIPDDVERLGIVAALVAGLTGFLQSEHGPRVVFKVIREVFGWIGEGFGTVSDETGKAGQICDQVSDIAYRGTKTELKKLHEDRAFRKRVNAEGGSWWDRLRALDRRSDMPLPTFLWSRKSQAAPQPRRRRGGNTPSVTDLASTPLPYVSGLNPSSGSPGRIDHGQ